MSTGGILLLLVALSFLAYWLKLPNKGKGSPSVQRGWGRVEYYGAGMDGEARIAKIGDMPVEYHLGGMVGAAMIAKVGDMRVEYLGGMTGEARIARIGDLPVEYALGMGDEARILRIGDMPVEYGGSGMDGRSRIEYIGTR